MKEARYGQDLVSGWPVAFSGWQVMFELSVGMAYTHKGAVKFAKDVKQVEIVALLIRRWVWPVRAIKISRRTDDLERHVGYIERNFHLLSRHSRTQGCNLDL